MEETVKRGRGRGRGRGKRGRGRGRGKKVVHSSEEEDNSLNISEEIGVEPAPPEVPINDAVMEDAEKENTAVETTEEPPQQQFTQPPIDMEADISQLEAPTFTTLSRGPPEPMLRLKWNHKVNLIGEKVLNPMIYNCDQCDKPILVYGRMIPCKHVFCLKCARAEPVKICPRCKDKVVRVEQSSLGTVFMCMHGGSRYGNTGCRRTYLSQRDLQAHINHRHVTQPVLPEVKPLTSAAVASSDQQKRKISESSVSGNTSIQPAQQSRTPIKAPKIAPLTTSNLTRANLAQLNEQQQKAAQQAASGHHHMGQHDSVADASYYSNAISSYGNQSSFSSASAGGGMHAIPAHLVQPPPPPAAHPQIQPFFSFGQPQQFPHQPPPPQIIPPPNFHGGNNQNQWNQQQQYFR